MKGRIPTEELIAAGPHQRGRQPRLADRPGDVVGVQAVERRLIERIDGRFESRGEVRFRETDLPVFGTNRPGDRPGELSFVVRLFLEAERKRVNGRLVRTLRKGRDGTRVDPARQEHAESVRLR